MDVSFVNTASIAATQSAGVRASTATPAGISSPSQDTRSQLAVVDQSVVQEAAQARAQQKSDESRNAERQAADTKATVGRIRFELQDSTQVTKFFDTKDVLIYQVPPEGRVFLVTEDSNTADGRVEDQA
jgi:hypothetical protein